VIIEWPKFYLSEAELMVDKGPPTPPIAMDSAASTATGTPVTVTLQAFDDGLPDPPGKLSYIITSLPSHGTLTDLNAGRIIEQKNIPGNTNKVVYQPKPGYIGDDSFTFKANDGGQAPQGSDSNVAKVAILIKVEETVECRVSSSDDDGDASRPTDQQLGAERMIFGQYRSEPPYYICGMRFTDVRVPQGATITQAYLKVHSYWQQDYTVYGKIEAEAANDAIPFGSSRLIGILAKTATSVSWDHIGTCQENTWYTSPDIRAVIQEVINRSGWSLGNSLAIFHSVRKDGGGYRLFSSYDRTPRGTFAPKLEITYRMPVHSLTISSTSGGSVPNPGQGQLQYPAGSIVPVEAQAEANYGFVSWTGTAVDAHKVNDPGRASTAVTMDADYTLQANFGLLTLSTIYVDDDASHGGNGSCWESAFINLQDGLRIAAMSGGVVKEIRVAGGIYKPDRGIGIQPGDRTATFQLINGLAIKGGYGGIAEPDPNARDIELYRTVLSGDVMGNDVDVREPSNLANEPSRAENSFHVVTGSGTDQTAVLDGFIITGGYANSDREVVGGGMIVEAGSLQVVSCSFTGNFAQSGGGAMCIGGTNLNPTLANCTFSRNYAGNAGGGILNNSSSPITLYNCRFVRNSAGQYGGAMSDLEAGSRLTKCRFSWNSAINGGAMHITLGDTSFTNCILVGNWAEYGAGIFVADTSHVTIMNCTFAGNLAFKGNTMACNGFASGQPASSACEFANCILWDGDNEIWKNDNSVISVSYSNVQGAWPGQGNFNVDPLFADPDDGDYHLKSEAGRWDAVIQIWVKDQVTSQCIDAGNPSTPVGDELSPNGGRVNVGAYGGAAEASKSD
jgi:hypothetical protein